MATAGTVPCKAEPIVPEWAYQENCYSLWATIGAGSLCSRWSRQLFGPRQRRTGPGNRSFLFRAGFPAGTSRGRRVLAANSCQSVRHSREDGAHALHAARTRPPPSDRGRSRRWTMAQMRSCIRESCLRSLKLSGFAHFPDVSVEIVSDHMFYYQMGNVQGVCPEFSGPMLSELLFARCRLIRLPPSVRTAGGSNGQIM